MFVVDETTAFAIRQACQGGGELSGVVELRRHFPLITDNARAQLCLKVIMSWGPSTPSPEQGSAPGKTGNGVGQAGRGGDVGEDRRRHIGKPDDAPEMLERLEQDQERQARAGLARPLPREGDLCRPRRERFQLDWPWLGGQPRVGGVGDDRHGARLRLRRRKRWDGRGRLDAGLFQHLAHARS